MSDDKIKILIYASVPDSAMLSQGFYAAEADGLLEDDRVENVHLTNKLKDIIYQDYDGLLCYFYSYSAIAALFAKIRKKKVIATGGGEQVWRAMAPSWFRYLVRLFLFCVTLSLVDKILATSTTDLKKMRAIGFFRKKSIILSHHSVKAVDLAHPSVLEPASSEYCFVTICGMDSIENLQRKGVFRCIDLLATVQKSTPAAQLTIIGRDTLSNIVFDYARSKGCAEQVRVTGYIEESQKFQILKNSRNYLQLSEYEGFGIGALEAFALGCRVIHTNVGGLRDTIGDFGFILRPGQRLCFEDLKKFTPPSWEIFDSHLSKFKTANRVGTVLSSLNISKT